jgi:hypothetical protein
MKKYTILFKNGNTAVFEAEEFDCSQPPLVLKHGDSKNRLAFLNFQPDDVQTVTEEAIDPEQGASNRKSAGRKLGLVELHASNLKYVRRAWGADSGVGPVILGAKVQLLDAVLAYAQDILNSEGLRSNVELIQIYRDLVRNDYPVKEED